MATIKVSGPVTVEKVAAALRKQGLLKEDTPPQPLPGLRTAAGPRPSPTRC